MHPSEETLIAYAAESQPSPAGEAVEAHLTGCPPCRDRYETILRELADGLDEEESWLSVEEADPVAAQELREQAAQKRREDEEAEELLGPLLKDPEAFVWEDVARKRKFHTGGVARKLAATAYEALYAKPLHALNLAETAIAITNALPTSIYHEHEIAAWLGTSWKERANALRFLGRYRDTLESLDRAEKYYGKLPDAEFDLASVTFIRATVYYEQQLYDEAEEQASRSTAAFAHRGQREYYLRSRHLEGAIAFEKGELARAAEIFETILAYGEAERDVAWIAREAQALGQCSLERRDFTSATHLLSRGMLHFRELGIHLEEIRCRWGLAIIIQREGHFRKAIDKLREVRESFISLGSVSDAALVTLDLMETLLAMGRHRDVLRAAGNVQSLFKEAGMLTGAVTAADYLKQAAALRKVTPSLIAYVRNYLRRVDLQPDFAFVPPAGL